MGEEKALPRPKPRERQTPEILPIKPMNDILHKPTVLVLNRNWQAINVRTPADAFCQMATDAATALDIDGTALIPVKWSDWITLPVRGHDTAVTTPRGPIRVPTVIVVGKYAKVPIKRPRFSAKAIRERDGFRCQYTGELLDRNDGNIDHVVPRSRGGATTWDNCVLASKRVNSRKADRLPEEVGLRLLKKPAAPRAVPATLLIRNQFAIGDWDHFLVK